MRVDARWVKGYLKRGEQLERLARTAAEIAAVVFAAELDCVRPSRLRHALPQRRRVQDQSISCRHNKLTLRTKSLNASVTPTFVFAEHSARLGEGESLQLTNKQRPHAVRKLLPFLRGDLSGELLGSVSRLPTHDIPYPPCSPPQSSPRPRSSTSLSPAPTSSARQMSPGR